MIITAMLTTTSVHMIWSGAVLEMHGQMIREYKDVIRKIASSFVTIFAADPSPACGK